MRRFLGVAFVAACAAQAFALLPTVIYSTIQTSPTSDVPGIAGLKFDNDTTGFSRPYRSADGQNWIMEVQFNTASTADDEAIMLGSGNAGNIVVREGDQAPWAASGELVGPIREKMQVNNSGHYAFGQNLAGTAPTDRDEQIVMWNGAFGVVAAEGGAVPGVAGENFGLTLSGASITNGGAAGFHASSTVGALPTTQDDFLFLNGAAVAQAGIAGSPMNQIGAETWNLFNTDDFQVSADGSKWMIIGTITGATTSNSVVAVNDSLVIQESIAYPGMTSTVSTVSEALMFPGGSWYARGTTLDATEDWLIFDGNLIAETDDPVPGGLPGETFDDTLFSTAFFFLTANDNGDYIYGGTTSNADVSANAVLVLNNSQVVLREGDAVSVDIDGDGTLDTAFLSVFNNDDAFLTNDMMLYFTAELRDAAGASLGQAFMNVQVPEPSTVCLALLGLAGLLRRR